MNFDFPDCPRCGTALVEEVDGPYYGPCASCCLELRQTIDGVDTFQLPRTPEDEDNEDWGVKW